MRYAGADDVLGILRSLSQSDDGAWERRARPILDAYTTDCAAPETARADAAEALVGRMRAELIRHHSVDDCLRPPNCGICALRADADQAGERPGKTWNDCNDDEKRARLREDGGRR